MESYFRIKFDRNSNRRDKVLTNNLKVQGNYTTVWGKYN